MHTYRGSLNLFLWLLSHHVKLNTAWKTTTADDNDIQQGDTALIIVAKKYEYHVIPAFLLIKHGANVNAVNSTGDTALYEAAHNNAYAIVKQLLKHGAISTPDLLYMLTAPNQYYTSNSVDQQLTKFILSAPKHHTNQH